jgi:hypothetical protein
MSNDVAISRTRVSDESELMKIIESLKKSRKTQWLVVTDLRTWQTKISWARPGAAIPQWWQ